MVTKKGKYFLLFISVQLLLSGCWGTKHLKENEFLLHKQSIVVTPPADVDKDELRDMYAQRPNRKFLGILPFNYLVTFYYAGKKRYNQEKFIEKKKAVEEKFNKKIEAVPETNTKKINNLQFRKLKRLSVLDGKIENGNTLMQWGEPLSVFDTALSNLTRDRLSDYLFSKGYFLNKVTYEADTIGLYTPLEQVNRVRITYTIRPGKAYFIDTILYSIPDTAIFNLLKQYEKASLIIQGQRYDQDKFTQERERIDLLLKDNGYYDFSRQYVEFDIDTSYSEDIKVAVMVAIKEPARRGYHKKFVIDEVNFTTDAGINQPGAERSGRRYHDIDYQFYYDSYNLRILSQRVFILPGSLFSRTQTFNTQRQLANLDAFKFVNINYDTTGGKFVANIFTSPLDRYQWSNEVGVNVTQGFPGPFYNINLKKRNVFRGLESLDLTGRIGFEGVASATSAQSIYNQEAGINASMTFPQIVFPLKEDVQFRLGRYNPRTKLQAGYSYTHRPEYRRTNASFSGTYYMENKRTTQYSFTFANINIIDTLNTSREFREFLARQESAGNYSLVNAFSPSFVTSTIFGIAWNKNNYGAASDAIYIRATVESGGTIWNFFSPDLITEKGLQYFKYYRFGLDIRKSRILSRSAILAYRANGGVAYGYGDNKSVPYEKLFFVGGSNSVRAWRPRRLGPGSYKPGRSGNPEADGWFDYNIEKPGEILLEASVELRKKLFGFVHGAVFLDAGNVWTFKQLAADNTDDAGNSKFQWDRFYKEIGVGTGLGVRFDFTFIILRFDVGIKVFDPARGDNGRFVLDEVRFFKPYATRLQDGTFTNYKEPAIYNIGIGFPF